MTIPQMQSDLASCTVYAGFLTHYFEADKGPLRNICDLSDEQIEFIIEAEKGAETAFNRFALGSDFFKLRRAADGLLVEKYAEKFGIPS